MASIVSCIVFCYLIDYNIHFPITHGFFKLLLFVNDSETNVSYVSEIRNCFSNIGPIDGKI